MRILRVVTISALLACLAVPGLEAGGLRIALLASTEVQGDTILLANLLPRSASQRIRNAAGKIALGEAPQNGTARQFSRETLSSAIESAGLVADDFAIPVAVTVRRGSRFVSGEEVFAAIHSALAKNPVTGLSHLQPQDISLEAAVRVPPGDVGLEVMQITFDQFTGRARVRLLPRSAPGVLPFYVTAMVEATSSEPASARRMTSIASHSPTTSAISAPVLVAADHLARLHLHSSNLDMLLEVRPLQKGRLGEVIRVRLLGSGKTFQARVTGDGYLDAIL